MVPAGMVMVRTPAASLNSSELMSIVPAATLIFPPPVKRQLVVAPLVMEIDMTLTCA